MLLVLFAACAPSRAATLPQPRSGPPDVAIPSPAHRELAATRNSNVIRLEDRGIIATALAACLGPNDPAELQRVTHLKGCYRPVGPTGVVAAPLIELHPDLQGDDGSRRVTWAGAPDEFDHDSLWRASWRLVPGAVEVRWNGDYHGVQMCLREQDGELIGYYATSKDFADDELLVPVKYSPTECEPPRP